MWGWIQRRQQRDYDLKRGVDADLVKGNQRRWKLTALLFGLGFASLGVMALGHFTGLLNQIAVSITMAFFLGAMLLGNLARAWGVFLDKPDPKEPPRLWKWRR